MFAGDPQADFEALARGADGRRINRAEPLKSLLLEKVASLGHSGKQRLAVDSSDYRILATWIKEGAAISNDRHPVFVALAPLPEGPPMQPGQSRAMSLTAVFADKSQHSVTALASFRSLDEAVADVDQAGLITARGPGQTYIIGTYQRHSSLVRIAVPRQPEGPVSFPQPAGRIDEICFARLKELNIPAADPCADEVFLRRVYLDTIGCLPTPVEARAFLADTAGHKRSRLIDALLARSEFADYWALKWGDLLRIKSEYPVRLWPKAVAAYSRWVRQSIAVNKPYDQFATELLVSTGSNFRDGPANFQRGVNNKDPQSLAENAALVFMGTRLSCARCHADPHERWTLQDNLGMAAFFGKVKFKNTGEWKEEIVYVDPDGGFRPVKTAPALAPRFLGGGALDIPADQDPRLRLAAWLTAGENPYFARNIANRIWAWLMDRGIVEESDDLRLTNPPSNRELLDYLAGEVIGGKYDLKRIYRLILNSQTYQLVSRSSEANQGDGAFYSHYYVRRLPAETLLDAISQVTQTTETYSSQVPEPYTRLIDLRAVTLVDGSITSPFLELFGRPARDTPYESERCSLATKRQALYLLNSSDVERKIASSNRLKTLLAEDKSPEYIVEELYLATFARFPTEAEKQALTKTLGDKKTRTQAAQDLLWALLNSKEFMFNH